MDTCSICKKEIQKPDNPVTAGYGENDKGEKVCYACCAEQDKAFMRDKGKNMLYFDGKEVTNWPGSLRLKPYYIKKGRHNIARTRTDVWFKFECEEWHGVQYGENTQICHCKRLKPKQRITKPENVISENPCSVI